MYDRRRNKGTLPADRISYSNLASSSACSDGEEKQGDATSRFRVPCLHEPSSVCTVQAANKLATPTPAQPEVTQPALYPRFQSLEALWSAVPSAQEVLPGPAIPNAPEEATAADPKSHLPATTAADGRPLTKLEIKRMKRAARPGRQPVGAPAAAAGPSPSSAAEAAVTAAARSERHPDQLKPSSAATASDDPTATKKKSSGTGNADEAQKIREALGYVAPSSLGTSEEPVGKKHKTEEKEGKNKKKKAKCEEGQGRDEEREPINLSTTSGLVSVTKPEDAVAPKPSAAGSKGVKFGFGFQLSEAQAAMETESKVSRIMLIDSATPEGLVPRRVSPQVHFLEKFMLRYVMRLYEEHKSLQTLRL